MGVAIRRSLVVLHLGEPLIARLCAGDERNTNHINKKLFLITLKYLIFKCHSFESQNGSIRASQIQNPVFSVVRRKLNLDREPFIKERYSAEITFDSHLDLSGNRNRKDRFQALPHALETVGYLRSKFDY